MVRSQQQKLRCLDLFSGAGGMSLGALNASVAVVIAIDNNKDAAETFKKNHPSTKFICDDIRNIDPTSLTNLNIDIIIGGPPCQGFSSSNTKTRNLNNKNNHLFKQFINFVKTIKPKWFIFENVEGIVSFNKGKTIAEIESKFHTLGYRTKKAILCAADYGVPQFRNRFFMVGNNIEIDFEFPEKMSKRYSVNDALSDLPSLENGDKYDTLPYNTSEPNNEYAKSMRINSLHSTQNYVSTNKEYILERYKHVPQGGNWQCIPKELMTNYKNTSNCHSGIYRRLDGSKPSIVISNYRKNMLIHPYSHRGLSVREAARLQSFPDNFSFCGSLMQIQQQIGNAVPPVLAESIFQKILIYHHEI